MRFIAFPILSKCILRRQTKCKYTQPSPFFLPFSVFLLPVEHLLNIIDAKVTATRVYKKPFFPFIYFYLSFEHGSCFDSIVCNFRETRSCGIDRNIDRLGKRGIE